MKSPHLPSRFASLRNSSAGLQGGSSITLDRNNSPDGTSKNQIGYFTPRSYQQDSSINLFYSTQRLKNQNLYTAVQNDFLTRKNRLNLIRITKQVDNSQYTYERKVQQLKQLQDQLLTLKELNRKLQTEKQNQQSSILSFQKDDTVSISNNQRSLIYQNGKRQAYTAQQSLQNSPRCSQQSIFDSNFFLTSTVVLQSTNDLNIERNHSQGQSQLDQFQIQYSNNGSHSDQLYDFAYLTQKRNILKQKLDEKEKLLKEELQIKEQLETMKQKEKRQKIADDLKFNELCPQHENYQKASKNFDRWKMLNNSRKIVSLNLLSQRRVQLNQKRQFYQELLTKRVNIFQSEVKGLRQIHQAIQKRQKRVSEIKEHLNELKDKNLEIDQEMNLFLQKIDNKNQEFKIISGMEVLQLLEESIIQVSLSRETPQIRNSMQQLHQVMVMVDSNKPPDFKSQEIMMSSRSMKTFKSYEEHYSKFFNQQMHIPDDQFLSSRYHEVGLMIDKNLIIYNDLIETSEKKKLLIEEYQRFKETLEIDNQELQKYQKVLRKQGQRDTYNGLVFKVKDKSSNLRLKEDMNKYKNFQAEIFTTLSSIMIRSCYVISELIKVLKFYEPQQNEQQPLVFVSWQKVIEYSFYKLITDYSTRSLADSKQKTTLRSNNSSNLGITPKLAPKISLSDTKMLGSFRSQRMPFLTYKKNTFGLRRLNDSDLKSKGSSGIQVNQDCKILELEQMNIFQDFNQFITQMVEVNKMVSQPNFKYMISYEEAINQIRQDKVLSMISKKLSKKYLRKYLSLSYFKTEVSQEKLLNLDQAESQYNLSHQKSNQNNINSLTTLNSTEKEVDYIDPITKGIDKQALLHDRLIEDAKKEAAKKEQELIMKQSMMNDEDKKRLEMVKFMKYQRDMRQFERDENIFQKNYKNNINKIFDSFYTKSIITDPKDNFINLEGIQPYQSMIEDLDLLQDKDINANKINDQKIDKKYSGKIDRQETNLHNPQQSQKSGQQEIKITNLYAHSKTKSLITRQETLLNNNLNEPSLIHAQSSNNNQVSIIQQKSSNENQSLITSPVYRHQKLNSAKLSQQSGSPVKSQQEILNLDNQKQSQLQQQHQISSNQTKVNQSNNKLIMQAIKRRESIKEFQFQDVKVQRSKKKEKSIILNMLQEKFPELSRLPDQDRYNTLIAGIGHNIVDYQTGASGGGAHRYHSRYDETSSVDYLDENDNEDQETHSQNSISFSDRKKKMTRMNEDIDDLEISSGLIKVKKIYSNFEFPKY